MFRWQVFHRGDLYKLLGVVEGRSHEEAEREASLKFHMSKDQLQVMREE